MIMPILDSNRFRREVLLVCNVSSDVQTFWASLRLVLDRNIETDSSSWFTFDPATGMPTSHTNFRALPEEDQVRLIEHEATVIDDVGRFLTVGRDKPHLALLSDVTGGKLETSARFREILQPNDFGHELRVAFVRNGICWGGMALYRKEGGPAFINPEVKALANVVEFLGESMHRALLTSKLNREEDGSRVPGIIVLGPANRVDLISPPAVAWLTELGVELGGDAWSTVLPGEVYAIASQARRTGAGHFDAGPAVSIATTASGDKVELHATLLEAEPQGPVAVIIEPVRRPQIAAPIVAGYGLSAEEAEVLRLVLLALPTDGVADQVAPLLAKIGVADTGELVARVWADHYAVSVEDGRPVGPDGWFEEGWVKPEPVEDEDETAEDDTADDEADANA
jgi:hypothetical protein